jgi:quinol monooxygenase YgiN
MAAPDFMGDRRTFLYTMAACLIGGPSRVTASPRAAQEKPGMFGLIGKMTAVAGQRDALIAILLDGTGEMPGCLSYVVARDVNDEHAIWITEVWDSPDSHKASLSLPSVRAAIQKGKPLIAGFGDQVTTMPVGGYGLRG